MIDGLFGETGQPIPDPFVRMAMGQETFLVPDAMATPNCVVYWDFLRRSTATLSELEQAGVQFDLTAIPSNDFAYDRSVARVHEYYGKLYDFLASVGIDDTIAAFGPKPTEPTDDLGKQDLINEVLQYFQGNVTVSATTTGPSTASVTYKYEPALPLALSSGIALDTNDAELLWSHLFAARNNAFTILDQLFTPNSWVYVYARGRVDPTVYHPVYVGLITTVVRTSENGLPSITIQCEDTLKFLHKTPLRLNPAVADPEGTLIASATGQNYSVFAHPLAGMSLEDVFRYTILGEDRGNDQGAYPPLGVLDYSLLDEGSLADYYTSQTIPASLSELAGGLGPAIRAKRRDSRYRSKLVIWGLDELVPYRAMLPSRKPDFFTTDFRNRLEVLQEVAKRCMVEFYADCCGNYVVHPYRTAQAYLNRHVYTSGGPEVKDTIEGGDPSLVNTPSTYILPTTELRVQTETITDQDLVTVLDFQGEYPMTGETTAQIARLGDLRTLALNPELVARYGIWYRPHVEPLVNTISTPNELLVYALARLAYMNKDVVMLQLTLENRAEMRVARPIYVPDQRDVAYIVTIDHTWPSRGDATTGLSLTFMRKTDAPPIDFTEWLVQSNQQATSLTAADFDSLVQLFQLAAGFGRIGNLVTVTSTPGSIQSDPTTIAIVDAAQQAQSPGEDAGDFSTDLKLQAARETLDRGLAQAAGP